MSFINTAVRDRLAGEHAEVFFVSGAATKWWNSQRTDKKHEICLLGGWYWSLNGQEAGPFRTASGAWRDVYYRRVLEQAPPCLNQHDLERVEKELKSRSPKNRKAKAGKTWPKRRVPSEERLRA